MFIHFIAKSGTGSQFLAEAIRRDLGEGYVIDSFSPDDVFGDLYEEWELVPSCAIIVIESSAAEIKSVYRLCLRVQEANKEAIPIVLCTPATKEGVLSLAQRAQLKNVYRVDPVASKVDIPKDHMLAGLVEVMEEYFAGAPAGVTNYYDHLVAVIKAAIANGPNNDKTAPESS